ncbi:hypothetical protein PspLS_10563, partial [Pyricularia sp. CBS 133598]
SASILSRTSELFSAVPRYIHPKGSRKTPNNSLRFCLPPLLFSQPSPPKTNSWEVAGASTWPVHTLLRPMSCIWRTCRWLFFEGEEAQGTKKTAKTVQSFVGFFLGGG